MPILNSYVIAVFVYPLLILILPIKTSRSVLVTVAFLYGLLVDFFYNSPGVHAAALLVTAYLRAIVLKALEPRGGYRTEQSPTLKNFGLNWFLIYAGILLITHYLVYFSIDAFSFVYIDKILVNAILGFAVSYILVLFYQIFVRV